MNKKTEQYDVVIIGGGAAGLSAGIYCGRAGLHTLIIEKSLVGGLATYTDEIENYPGFPNGTTGGNLMKLFQKQAKKFGVKFIYTDVRKVQLAGNPKTVSTFRTDYSAKAVILAGGGKPRLTGAKNEEKFLYDKGISFCATCDAAANTGKAVLVVGSGYAAIEESIFLTKFAKQVYLSVLHDPGEMDCHEIAKNQALHNDKITFIWNTAVDSFAGETRLDTVVLKNIKTGQLVPVRADTCFLFIGYLPDTQLFRDILPLSQSGHLITNEQMETAIPGVFAAGDIREKVFKQVISAANDGATAGYCAEKYIAESEIYQTQIANGGKPSLVYLYNAADRQSLAQLPLLDSFQQKNGDALRITKVDVYKSDGLAKRLGVSRYPCLVYLEEGRVEQVLDAKDCAAALEFLSARLPHHSMPK